MCWMNKYDLKKRDENLANRAVEVITENIYSDNGWPWSPYRCITPGKTHFPGIWNGDSAFHAMGVSRWDTALARESILGFLQFQRDDVLDALDEISYDGFYNMERDLKYFGENFMVETAKFAVESFRNVLKNRY